MPANRPANNLTVGGGRVFVRLRDPETDAFIGQERDIGNNFPFTFGQSSESLDAYSNEDGAATILTSALTKLETTINFASRNVDEDNLALFANTSIATVTGVATPVVAEAHDSVGADEWIQLGTSTTNPSGVRDVGSVAVDDDVATGGYVADTDYYLDATLARIQVLAGGGLVGKNLRVNYTPGTTSRKRLTADDLTTKTVSVRFIANNSKGSNKDWYFPKVTLTPNGENSVKGDPESPSWQELSWTGKVGKIDGQAPFYIDGRPAA